MTNCYAVLIDTVSIQSYIFSSNKLRENLGASYLIKSIYRSHLAWALSSVTHRTPEEEERDLDKWQHCEAEAPDCTKVVEIGYVGGGNALLFFQNEELAHRFIETWTKRLLVHAPGLITAIACAHFPSDPEAFRKSLDRLFKLLKQNKASHSPLTSLPRHGITTECPRSGLSAETYNSLVQKFVSAGTNARIEASGDLRRELEKYYEKQLGDRFGFTNELDQLGGIRGEDSHLAIVHIDGNDMGKRFQNAKTLKEICDLSKSMGKATQNAFDKVIETTIEHYDQITDSLGSEPTSEVSRKDILPIRPIVLGGDDVTFVCDGKLGIYFAKTFIEAFEDEQNIPTDGKRLTACAGVAIIKTKYPFYRGYRLAEELCTSAKRKRKYDQSSDSYLDFHVSLGGIDSSLEEIRDKHYHYKSRRSLLYRPFKILPKERFDEHNLELFLELAQSLDDAERGLPKNKLHDLRDVLTLSEDAAQKFVEELTFRGRKLPDIEGYQYAEKLFQNGITPYFDMIEILQFYPAFALPRHGEEENEKV